MLNELKPKRKDRVFDLVEEAGYDVSDWVASARNCAVRANPKYCYEWAFVEEGKLSILNLWHDMFTLDPDRSIVHRYNFRADASGNIGKPTWVLRATRLDRAVQEALREGVTLRIIVNDGVKRRRGDPSSTPSKVTARQLDPVPWHVAEYDSSTGEHVLRRGRKAT